MDGQSGTTKLRSENQMDDLIIGEKQTYPAQSETFEAYLENETNEKMNKDAKTRKTDGYSETYEVVLKCENQSEDDHNDNKLDTKSGNETPKETQCDLEEQLEVNTLEKHLEVYTLGEQLEVNKNTRKRKRKPIPKIVFDEKEKEERRMSANIMERNRMKSMNDALCCLRDKLPDEFKLRNKKMSKIRTLRVAIGYIRSLSDLVKADDIARQEQIAMRQTYLQGHYNYLRSLGLSGQFCGQPGESMYFPYGVIPDRVNMPGMFLSPQRHISQIPIPYFPFMTPKKPTPNKSNFVGPYTPSNDVVGISDTPIKNNETTPNTPGGSSCGLPVSSPFNCGNEIDRKHFFQSPETYPACSPLNLVSKFSSSCSRNATYQRKNKRSVSASFSSPLIERNSYELNTSFLSSASDDILDNVQGRQDNFGMEGVFPPPEERESEKETQIFPQQEYII